MSHNIPPLPQLLPSWEYENKYNLVIKEDIIAYYAIYDGNAKYSDDSFKSLIGNFKKTRQQQEEHPFLKRKKNEACRKIADFLKISFLHNSSLYKDYVWIPCTPSKHVNSLDYDDRLIRVLNLVRDEYNELNLCSGFSIKQDRQPLHESNNRNVHDIQSNLICSQNSVDIIKNNNKLILFDDILTTGATFKAHKNKILEFNSDADVRGIVLGVTKFNNVNF